MCHAELADPIEIVEFSLQRVRSVLKAVPGPVEEHHQNEDDQRLSSSALRKLDRVGNYPNSESRNDRRHRPPPHRAPIVTSSSELVSIKVQAVAEQRIGRDGHCRELLSEPIDCVANARNDQTHRDTGYIR